MGILSQILTRLLAMPAPSNRIPVRLARGERALLEASIDAIQEGEIVFARDEDSLYVKENGQLVNVATGAGLTEQVVSAEIKWVLGLNDALTGYTFSGQGLNATITNPTIYLVRGQKYRFQHQLATDPFRIETTNGEAYSNGITNNPAFDETLTWEVSMQAPQRLRYSSTSDPSKSGEFIILSDTFSLGIQDLDDVSTTEPLDGQALIYSSSQDIWAPASLTTGGVTDLSSLTDVDTQNAIQDDVLKYNGEFWVAAPEAVDPGTAGRKSSVSVTDTRSGNMLGTEFPLASDNEWESLGFNLLTTAEGNGLDQFANATIEVTKRWSPIGRTDSRSIEPGAVYFDGSGRVFGFASNPIDFAPIASTKELSFPQNGSFGMTAFLSTTFTISKAGVASTTAQGYSWTVLRIEYANGFGGLLAMEYWYSQEGHFKMLYGRAVDGFVFDAGPNKNGFTFTSRSGDSTLGDINTQLPGLTSDGDYAVEVWYNGNGYNLDDLANVASTPPRQGFPLVWNEDRWEPGSIVRSGSQASTSGGNLGIFAVDELYLYVCVGENSWKRVPLESFV